MRYNTMHEERIDVTQVGLSDGPQRGTPDPDILIWCEQLGYVLITHDRDTMPQHLADHLASGKHSPGVFILKRGQSVREIIEMLAIITYASEPHEWADQVYFTD